MELIQLLLISILAAERSFARPTLLGRLRRQAPPVDGDFKTALPIWSPLPGRTGTAPMFPHSTAFTTGIHHDFAGQAGIHGNLNVPIKDWAYAPFDLKGDFGLMGTSNEFGLGVLARPTNPLGLSPQASALLAQRSNDPGAPEMPVLTLPSGNSFVNCRPPVCNPFVHSVATGISAGESKLTGFSGNLDFPVDILNTRFPISGTLEAPYYPNIFDYGHHLVGIDPYPMFRDSQRGGDRTGPSRRIVQEVISDEARKPAAQEQSASGIFRRYRNRNRNRRTK